MAIGFVTTASSFCSQHLTLCLSLCCLYFDASCTSYQNSNFVRTNLVYAMKGLRNVFQLCAKNCAMLGFSNGPGTISSRTKMPDTSGFFLELYYIGNKLAAINFFLHVLYISEGDQCATSCVPSMWHTTFYCRPHVYPERRVLSTVPFIHCYTCSMLEQV